MLSYGGFDICVNYFHSMTKYEIPNCRIQHYNVAVACYVYAASTFFCILSIISRSYEICLCYTDTH